MEEPQAFEAEEEEEEEEGRLPQLRVPLSRYKKELGNKLAEEANKMSHIRKYITREKQITHVGTISTLESRP